MIMTGVKTARLFSGMCQKHYCILCCGIACIVLILVTRESVVLPDDFLPRPSILSSWRNDTVTPANDARDRPAAPVYVLLLTYMRSGSSFTGDVLQQATEAFYIFEPLRRYYGENDVSATEMVTNSDPIAVLGARNIIRSWFTCNLDNLPDKYLKDMFMKHGKKSSEFSACYNKLLASGNGSTTAFSECKNRLTRLCLNSPVRILKTIRMTLHEVRALMDELPNLYIVHLVRDPRGTLNSQRKLGKCSDAFGGNVGCTNLLCKRLENDVYEEEKMLTEYAGRVFPVLYQDIAKQPIVSARTLYEFMGQEFTREAEQYVFNITQAEHDTKKVVSTSRSNSSEHVDSWKTEMPPDFVKIIENRCNYVLRRFHLEFTLK